MLAARNGNSAIVKLLINNGAEVKAKNIVSNGEEMQQTCYVIVGSLIFRQMSYINLLDIILLNHMSLSVDSVISWDKWYTHSFLLFCNKS